MHANCTRGVYRHRKRVCAKSWLWERKKLTTLGNRTCERSVPAQCSTDWATSPPILWGLWSWTWPILLHRSFKSCNIEKAQADCPRHPTLQSNIIFGNHPNIQRPSVAATFAFKLSVIELKKKSVLFNLFVFDPSLRICTCLPSDASPQAHLHVVGMLRLMSLT